MIPDDELVRFRALVAQLNDMVAAPSPLAAVNPDGTPGLVAAGELIESAWGNATSNTIKGLLIPNHINADGNAVGYLKVEGGRFSGQVDANGFVRVNFLTAYTLPYTITASNLKWPEEHIANPLNPDATGFTLSVRNISTGAVAANAFVDCAWQAIGRRT